MPGLTSLRALHTIQFRTDDTCLWVMREFKKFAVDNVAHNPDMKLEYIALDTSIERLVRRKQPNTAKADKKGKGKAKGGMDHTSKALAELIIGLGSSSPWGDGASSSSTDLGTPVLVDWQESSDEEDPGAISKTGLKVETIEGMRFCDVSGVRIFEKDVLAGRL
jgi:hypothetical protein